jgi:hypothetical protein
MRGKWLNKPLTPVRSAAAAERSFREELRLIPVAAAGMTSGDAP